MPDVIILALCIAVVGAVAGALWWEYEGWLKSRPWVLPEREDYDITPQLRRKDWLD